jgi:hypothetical protein
MPHFRFSEAEVREAVNKSISIRETMVRLGYKQFAGGSHYCLSRAIKRLGIDSSHFLGQRAYSGDRVKSGRAKKKTPNEILVYHADGTRAKTPQVRRAMIAVGKIERCYICGIDSWMDRPFNLEIEHKDGDFQNDRRENLEFICPNCHSQTVTYCRCKKRGSDGGLAQPLALGTSVANSDIVGSNPTAPTI